jgi:hypothetical protein
LNFHQFLGYCLAFSIGLAAQNFEAMGTNKASAIFILQVTNTWVLVYALLPPVVPTRATPA